MAIPYLPGILGLRFPLIAGFVAVYFGNQRDQLRGGSGAHLALERGAVILYGSAAELHPMGYFLVQEALKEQVQHLSLAG